MRARERESASVTYHFWGMLRAAHERGPPPARPERSSACSGGTAMQPPAVLCGGLVRKVEVHHRSPGARCDCCARGPSCHLSHATRGLAKLETATKAPEKMDFRHSCII